MSRGPSELLFAMRCNWKLPRIESVLTGLAIVIPIPVSAAPAAFQEAIEAQLATNPDIPGVIADVRVERRGIHWSGAAGLVDTVSKRRLSPSDVFRIASITKLYTSASIFVLMEKGKININRPIDRYISPATAGQLTDAGHDPNQILVRHLLAHVSGIPDYAQSEAYAGAVVANPRRIWTRSEQIGFALQHFDSIGAPGARFGYSDTGYIILGEIIERATGKSLNDAYADLLRFKSRRIRQTKIESSGDIDRRAPRMAHAYMKLADATQIDASFDLYGGGGLIAPASEVTRFTRAAFRGELFASPATLASALMVPVAERPSMHIYANLGGPRLIGRYVCWGHGGFWGSVAVYCPEPDIALTITVNATGVGLDAFAAKLVGLVDGSQEQGQ